LGFNAETGGSDDLKAIVSAISTLVEEATFVVDVEGITFRGMDPSHVALIDISWPNSAFEKYECDSDVKFGVRIDEIAKLIKRAGKKDSIHISISEKNMLLVTIAKNKKYKMRLIESSATNTPLPKSTYDVNLKMPLKVFDKILGDVQAVAKYLTINTTPDSITFSGRGDTGEVDIEIDPKNQEEVESLEVTNEGAGTYDLEYINSIVKAVGTAASTITCEYSQSKPLRIEFKVANIGVIHFYLAPRVES